MTNLHTLVGHLTVLTSPPALLGIIALTVANVVGAVVNAVAFARNRRRWRYVQARERRLDPGPITAAVGAFSRAAAE
jgi:hypothetical protein